jgi:hypothetical protein
MGKMSFQEAKKFAFGYDVAALAEYINEQSTEILTKDVLAARTISLVNVQAGIKHKEKLKKVDIDVIYQDGTNCEITPSGEVVFTDREIEVSPIAILMKFCNNELRDTWAQLLLAAGSNAETQEMPAEAIIVNHFLKKHNDELEKLIWKGDKSLSSGNLQFADGFLKLFLANVGQLINLNPTGATTFTSSNAFDLTYAAFEAMPEEVLDNGAKIFMGRNFFTKLAKNLVDLNYFKNYTPDDIASLNSFVLPGTDLVVEKVPGLNNVNEFYIAKPSELTVGTDLENDFESIDLWYEKKDDSIYFRVKFKVGTQVPFLNQIGRFALATS